MAIAAEKPSPVPFRERVTCTIEEAGCALGLSRDTIYRMIRDGRLEALKLNQGQGCRRLVRVRSLLRLVGEE